MSEPINVGDLVMYTRSCCIAYRDNTHIFRVGTIHKPWWHTFLGVSASRVTCSACGATLPDEMYAAEHHKQPGAPLSWLKRIPPLGELEGEQRREELPRKEPVCS